MRHQTIVDFETYFSLKDGISVTAQGNDNYIKSADAYIVSIVDEEFEWCGTIEQTTQQFGESFWSDPNRDFWAANSNFDFGWAKKYWPSAAAKDDWQCILDRGNGNQLPRDLANLARVAMNVKVDKSLRDSMNGVRFEDLTPEKQQALIEYCLNDSIQSKALLAVVPPLSPIEQKIAAHTRLMNRRGVCVDVDRVEKDITKLQEIRHQSFKAIPWHLTDKPLSPKALARYCEANNIPVPVSRAKNDEDCAELMSDHPKLKDVIERMRNYTSSNKNIEKAKTLLDRVNENNRLPLDFIYCGAPHTRRWSSQGFNIQNLEKEPTFLEKIMMVGSDGKPCVDMEKSNYVWAREWFVPSPGKKFLIFDFSQIEPRCLNWLVSNDEMLAMIRAGYGIYEAYAASFKGWRGNPGTLKHTDPKLYSACKADFLGLGYGMGWAKYQAKVTELGITLTEAEAREKVATFRKGNPKTVAFWGQLDGMLKRGLLSPDKGLNIEMPTGEFLRYFHIQQTGKKNLETGKMGVSYSASKVKGIFDQRGRVYNLWGGAMCENVTQRMARDVMSEAILRVETAGFPVIFSVHDEVVLEVDDGSDKFLADAKAEAERLLTMTPEWAEGLPLAVEGGYESRYTK